ncbi:hypothetical protein [Bdellovibrio sp. HCB-110]|uniref:hypothetical protein n=1 Tax=Bdellovibrio sp. HCB-110 TaxID=3391182 RepID=UPI0039B38015
MRSFTVAIVIALCMNACSFKKDDAKNDSTPKDNSPADVVETIQKEQEKQAFEGQLTEKNVLVTFEEQSEPMLYKMRITWPEQVKRMQVIVNKKTPVIYTSINSAHLHEEPVWSSKEQEIELIAYDSLGAPVSSLALKEKAPLDYVLGTDLNLTQDTVIDVNRFFIFPKAQLQTNGHHLSIRTKKLIVEPSEEQVSFSSVGSLQYAHILTHVPSSKISNETDYRESAITIQADKAIGLLRVGLIGADGIDGRDGDAIEKDLGISKTNADKDGANGENGILKSKVIPNGINAIDGSPRDREVSICEKAPSNGKDGKPGNQGHSGENGRNGGPTGSLSIFVNEQEGLSVEVVQRPGQPGKGGLGASGHNGGHGGKPGLNPGHPCTSAQKGADGPQGPKGSDGIDGQPGKVGDILPGVKRIKVIQL